MVRLVAPWPILFSANQDSAPVCQRSRIQTNRENFRKFDGAFTLFLPFLLFPFAAGLRSVKGAARDRCRPAAKVRLYSL